MELQLEELKAPIEVHFVDGVPHPTTLQVRDVHFQLGNWRRKVDLLVSTLGGMDCILRMKFITHNNVLIKGHNRLVITTLALGSRPRQRLAKVRAKIKTWESHFTLPGG